MTGALVTKRLLLRPAEPGDLDALAAIWADPLVMRHMRRGPRTRNESRDRLQGLIEHHRRHGFGRWAVVERETGAVVGYAGIELREGGPELGYSLARAAWGRGYATEAAAAWLGHAFGDLGLERVEALVAAANSASIHVLEKVGMHPAGERTVEGHAWLVYASSAASALAATSRSPL